jgi:hypothetical protein
LDAVIERDPGEAASPALPEDHDTPFSPPDSPRTDPTEAVQRDVAAGQLSDTYPATDTNVQPEETYDEGLSGAAEASEPNAGNAVVDYNPEDDEREEAT